MDKTPPLMTGQDYTIDRATQSGEQWSVEATVGGVKRTYTVLGPAENIFKAVTKREGTPFEIYVLKSFLSS